MVVSLTLGRQRVAMPTRHLSAGTEGTRSVRPQHARLRPNIRGDAHLRHTAVRVCKTLPVFFQQPLPPHHVLRACFLQASPLWLGLTMSAPKLAQLEHHCAALIVALLVFMACGMCRAHGGAAGATRWRCELEAWCCIGALVGVRVVQAGFRRDAYGFLAITVGKSSKQVLGS